MTVLFIVATFAMYLLIGVLCAGIYIRIEGDDRYSERESRGAAMIVAFFWPVVATGAIIVFGVADPIWWLIKRIAGVKP